MPRTVCEPDVDRDFVPVRPAFKPSDRNVHRAEGRYGGGEGNIREIRCTCGHDLERHLERETCDVEDCPCVGFEIGWDEEEEPVRV